MPARRPVPQPVPQSIPEAERPQAERPLWQLIVELLPPRDAETEWFNLADVAAPLGITPHALSKHARDLWPSHEGHWRLKYSQCVSLIRRVCYAGRKLPSRAQVLAELQKRTSERGGA